MATSVFCIASSEEIASDIVSRLKAAGIHDSDISFLLPDASGSHQLAHELHTKAPEGTVAGASAGGVVGGTLGLLAGAGLLTIPGAGPFLAAGAVMSALSGAAVGATLGGVAGALVGMGIPEIEARIYEGKIRDGNILISVHASNGGAIRRASDIFARCGASDIGSTLESAGKARRADSSNGTQA